MLDFGLGNPSVRRQLLASSIFNLQLCLLFVLKVSREVLKGINFDYCALVLHCLATDISTKSKNYHMTKISLKRY